ncbi:hypothetical protein BT69DRAFT_1345274 [Atractiella rhizophila]|nr:hypothetical protein BT69DRAFT_1345274 [Atractiella rhizophila]
MLPQQPIRRRLMSSGKLFVDKVKETFWVNGFSALGKKQQRLKESIDGTSHGHSFMCNPDSIFVGRSLSDSTLFTSSESPRPSPTISARGVLPPSTSSLISSSPLTAAKREADDGIADSETPVAHNLRVDSLGIYVEIEHRDHFFTWDQFEQFLLDERNTAHLPADDVVRRTADILRENKKV